MTPASGSSITPDTGNGMVPDAVPEIPRRVRLMFTNQTAWLVRYAVIGNHARPDDRVRRDGDLITAITSSTGVMILPVDRDPAPSDVDTALSWLRMRESGDVLVWSAISRPSLDLPLMSRGCGDGFAPLWMWCDLPLANPTTPDPKDIEFSPASRRDRHAIAGVPNISSESLSVMLDLAESPGTSDAVWLLLARHRGRIIGGGAINLTGEGPETVAGLYNLGVSPDMQGRGIGTALTVALCRIAAERGAVGIALNATPAGERVYRKVGFAETGRGQTWFLPAGSLRTLPDAEAVRRAEALGSGMVEALDPALARTDRMPNGETPLTFAARFEQRVGRRVGRRIGQRVEQHTGQRDSVRWLIAHGAEPEIVALWKVGLRDEAIAAMGNPHLLDVRLGPDQTTALHEAIRNDDEELVRLLIGAGADLMVRDGRYHGTPLGWATALDRPQLARILEAAALGLDPSEIS